MTQDVTDECRPAAGAETHWFKHNDHGYRLYERISGTALGTVWMYRDFGGKSETLAAEGWTYHLPASPDDATERARLVDENARLRRLVQSAFNEGFSEGMREHTTSKGGKPWVDSKTCTALAALAPASPDDATERARLVDENARLRDALRAIADGEFECAPGRKSTAMQEYARWALR